jgi:hypothetical protein
VNSACFTATTLASVVTQLNEDLIIEDISQSFYSDVRQNITIYPGYTNVYKQGKHIFGTVLASTSETFNANSDNELFKLVHIPAVTINNAVYVSTDYFASDMNLGYVYCLKNNGVLGVWALASNKTHVKINLDYVCQ